MLHNLKYLSILFMHLYQTNKIETYMETGGNDKDKC
jgi:hypothetical protein